MPKRQTYRTLRYPLSLTLFSVLIAGCADGTPAVEGTGQATPTPADELLLASASVALPPPGVMPADLPDAESPGAQHVARYCVACHALPSPASHSATDWPGVIRRMWLRTELIDTAFGVPVPNGAERLVMAEYLVDNALQVRRSGLPAGAGRDLFVATCGRCHELPDPSQHSPEDWGGVVTRMTGHSESMLGQFTSQADTRRLIAYLQTASQ